jgi:ketosteroid isomerase-like protein
MIDMTCRDLNRFALGIALGLMLANAATAQVVAQRETVAQLPPRIISADDPMAAVRKYVDAFNRGDAAVMATTFAVPGSILDGMAPHVWQGPTATQDWYRDVLIEGKQHGASDYFITLGEPLHNNVTGDSAYVVVPATMTFKLRGQQVTQSGAVYTVALRKLAEGWRIAAWAWAKGTPR